MSRLILFLLLLLGESDSNLIGPSWSRVVVLFIILLLVFKLNEKSLENDGAMIEEEDAKLELVGLLF